MSGLLKTIMETYREAYLKGGDGMERESVIGALIDKYADARQEIRKKHPNWNSKLDADLEPYLDELVPVMDRAVNEILEALIADMIAFDYANTEIKSEVMDKMFDNWVLPEDVN